MNSQESIIPHLPDLLSRGDGATSSDWWTLTGRRGMNKNYFKQCWKVEAFSFQKAVIRMHCWFSILEPSSHLRVDGQKEWKQHFHISV